MNALALAVLFANLSQPASLTLDFDSTVVVTGREATAAFAFSELNDIVAKSAGRGFELDRGDKPAHRVFIGRSAEAENILGTSFWERLGKEESRVFAKGGDLFLVGEGDLGPLWAVYDFCEDNLGYRCFAPRADGERVDKAEKVVYSGLSTARRPAFDGYRWPSWKNLFSHRWNARLNVRNRSPNGLEVFVKAKVKGSLEASGHVAWHGYDLYLPAYGTRRKLPDGIVTNNFVTHPEWFSLNEKGVRLPDWQLCLSNRGCRDALTQAFFAWVRKYGRGNYMIASNDARHGHYCHCADCLALERKYGTMAGPLLDYLIELCGVLKEKGRDDVLVKTLAYCQETQQAPNLEKLPDNLLIDLAYVNMDRTPSELGFYAKGGFGRYSYLENAQKWGSLVSHYACWYYGGGAVVPPVFRMHKELNELYDAGVRCVYACGHDGGIEFNDLDDYFLLRLLMDPRQDPRRLLAETFELEFGAAGPMLVEYAGMLERARRRAIADNVSETSVPCIATYRQYDGGGIYTAEEVDAAQGIFERALAAVKNDPARAARVRKARILMDMTTILQQPRLRRERPGFAWGRKEAEARMEALLPAIGKWDSWCEDNLRKIMAETYNFSNLKDETVPAPLSRYPKEKVHRFLPPKSAFLAPPHKRTNDKRLTSYPDDLSVCGWAMADDIPDRHARDPKARHISIGIYLHDKASYSLHGCLQTDAIKGDRYTLLCIGKARLAPWTQMMFVYPKMDGLANAQLSRLYDPTYEQREYELWLSVRGEGAYFNGPGDTRRNRLYMDQFFAVQMDDEPEPVSPARTAERSLAAAVAADVSRPVRPAGVNGQAQWNGRALWFMYPPVFDFPCGADEEREVKVVGEGAVTKIFKAKGPFVSLESVWSELPVGNMTVACGTFSRTFWKARPFEPCRYPVPSRSYREALVAGYEYLLALPSLKALAETGKADMTYCLNCYPSKMHASTALGMVRYARLAPARRDSALKLARAAADHLLSLANPPDAALPGFTPTYEGENLTAKRYAGLNMLIYPADGGKAFLALYGVTKDGKYLTAAKWIAETYLKLQGEDGTWYLKLREKDGTPANKNRLHPKEVIDFMDGMFAATGDERYRACSERAFGYFEKGALQDWNWEGQFEDVEPQGKYLNLTKHGAASVAIRLLKCWPGDAKRLAQAREIVRFCEDQFVCWERPFKPERRPIYGRTWEPWTVEPAVVEQYSYREPVDASAAKMIRAYLALYRAERNPLDLAKARALGDACVRIQQENGRIQTIWHGDGGGLQGDWINCMFATLAALEELDSVMSEIGLR